MEKERKSYTQKVTYEKHARIQEAYKVCFAEDLSERT